ncbi:hypothetical protein BFJ71_g16858 [Fusarium oxysporum]|nr:hypothetical protein BFJ71_g16858 [Fusarium oxysporum]
MAELAIGVVGLVGTIDTCIRWGKVLVTACADYRHADEKTEEIILRIDVCWSRVLSQLTMTRELENSMAVGEKDLQQRTLIVLQRKLEDAVQRVSKVDKHEVKSRKSKADFARLKTSLQESVDGLESWQKRYEPPLFSLIKAAPPTIDRLLNLTIEDGTQVAAESSKVAKRFRRVFRDPSAQARNVFIGREHLKACSQEELPYCEAFIATRPGGSKRLIVDTTAVGAVSRQDAREFAHRFQDTDPFTFGIFQCKGVVEQPETSNMAFLFRIPDGYTVVRSTRQLLLADQAHDSLSDRLEMAKQLVNAVYYVHLYGFVHKNIRPETILSISKVETGIVPLTVFLIGFEVVRNAEGRTNPVNKVKWQSDLYRHPSRQGNHPDYYVMQHDIYSLGVCLLEIGMWESLIMYDTSGVAHPSSVFDHDPRRRDASFVKDYFVHLSRSIALRGKMGTKYSEVVQTCLTCLDEDNFDFGDEEDFQDDDGMAVGVRYLEKVMDTLNDICL